jgi:hypothetical protein
MLSRHFVWIIDIKTFVSYYARAHSFTKNFANKQQKQPSINSKSQAHVSIFKLCSFHCRLYMRLLGRNKKQEFKRNLCNLAPGKEFEPDNLNYPWAPKIACVRPNSRILCKFSASAGVWCSMLNLLFVYSGDYGERVIRN